MVVRAIRPDDLLALQAFHSRLSPDTVRNRFFAVHPDLPEAEALRFTSPAAGREVALVAIVEGDIAGVGRYARLHAGDSAEVAFVVQDRYQHHGIGTELFTLLARVAWDDGIRRFVADTFGENLAMLGVFGHTPTAATVVGSRRDGSVVHLTMRVTPPSAELTWLGDDS
jgi:RimJ/RimL family protein N-acetyltransferase